MEGDSAYWPNLFVKQDLFDLFLFFSACSAKLIIKPFNVLIHASMKNHRRTTVNVVHTRMSSYFVCLLVTSFCWHWSSKLQHSNSVADCLYSTFNLSLTAAGDWSRQGNRDISAAVDSRSLVSETPHAMLPNCEDICHCPCSGTVVPYWPVTFDDAFACSKSWYSSRGTVWCAVLSYFLSFIRNCPRTVPRGRFRRRTCQPDIIVRDRKPLFLVLHATTAVPYSDEQTNAAGVFTTAGGQAPVSYSR